MRKSNRIPKTEFYASVYHSHKKDTKMILLVFIGIATAMQHEHFLQIYRHEQPFRVMIFSQLKKHDAYVLSNCPLTPRIPTQEAKTLHEQLTEIELITMP